MMKKNKTKPPKPKYPKRVYQTTKDGFIVNGKRVIVERKSYRSDIAASMPER